MKKLICIFIILFSLVSCENIKETELLREKNQSVEKRTLEDMPGNVTTMEFCTQVYNGHEYVVCTVGRGVYGGQSVGVSIVHSPDCHCNKNSNESRDN